MTLRIPDMEDRFARLLNELNGGGRFDFDTDFVIKTTFVVFGQKAQYDYRKLSNDCYLRRLANEFDQVEKIFTALRVWMEDDALIKGSRFLRSKSALIPVIDYLLQNARWSGPKNKQESTSLRQFLYMAFFTRLFSRAGQSVGSDS